MIAQERNATALMKPLLDHIQRGTLRYTYRGVPTLKNPFDWALYPMLLWETRPRTIVEIGSNQGGSALWMADTMRSFSIPCHIHSVDINPVSGLQIPDVTFHGGDARNLEQTFPAEFMQRLARPLLVIEDSDHQMQTTLAVLRFFDRWLASGEYIVIEDGIVAAMGEAAIYGGGPHAAIVQFLNERPGEYELDTRYCDWFGLNVTWNINGFLRRAAKRPA
jgi:cephalosporin hydroxylase